jgi:hypothetical protein
MRSSRTLNLALAGQAAVKPGTSTSDCTSAARKDAAPHERTRRRTYGTPAERAEPVKLAAKNADVLRRQADGSWRFVIDNPWGTE